MHSNYHTTLSILRSSHFLSSNCYFLYPQVIPFSSFDNHEGLFLVAATQPQIRIVALQGDLDSFLTSNAEVGDDANSTKTSVGCTPLFTASAIVRAWSRRTKHNRDNILINLPVRRNPGIDLRQLEIFSLEDLQVATENFSNKNILGRGGFGTVYKGQLLDGSFIAVKRLKKVHNQGGETQFQTEVEMISRAIHRNLLRLRGFCMTTTERLLVYPYMVNGSVASCLRERPESQPPLSWEIRKRIALGAARGLAYLHDDCNPKIIHRDVKASNILLDEEFEAVVGDLGLAKVMNYRDTHVTTHVRGTVGHIAPEYLLTGKSSEKTDNYGYGVMLLELVSGRKTYDLMKLANDEDLTMIKWVRRLLQEKKFDILVDSDLQGDFLVEEVEHLLRIALLCTQGSPTERPKMSEIVKLLSMPLLNNPRYCCDPYTKPITSPRSMSTSPLGSPTIPTRSQQTKTQSQVSNSSVEKDKPTYLGQLECFSLREIVKATDNFNPSRILGRGAFGVVYKGELRGGQVVAIKRGKPKEKKNQSGEIQFQTEIEMIGKAVHRNLLRLLGFCVTSTERILVYPFMVNGSVASCLRGRTVSKPLPWEIRKKIAVGAAKGLAYLHDCKPRIIHRDMKAANILLDEDFEAIVADFGLVKFLRPEDTHVTTDVRGTYGYIAPEYVSSSRSTVRTDVYGYGATLMELISGKTPSALASAVSDDNITFTNWVEMVIKERKWEILIDPDLQGSYDKKEVERFIQVSFLCTQQFPKGRPTMAEVLRMLDDEDHDLATRWEEWQKLLLEEKQADQTSMNKVRSWITDTVSKLPSEELSEPR